MEFHLVDVSDGDPRGGRAVDSVTVGVEVPWSARQRIMEDWYANLVTKPEDAARSFGNDYGPLLEWLATCSGRILDVGGGNGIARGYLPRGVDYVALDPSFVWDLTEFGALTDTIPSIQVMARRVRGSGEHLPFPDRSFDGVLCIFTLNHVESPVAAVREMIRVLRPGGKLKLVLEDMEPSWWDLALSLGGALRRNGTRWLPLKLATLRGARWPLQADHARIDEGELTGWLKEAGLLVKRAWLGDYLALEASKRA